MVNQTRTMLRRLNDALPGLVLGIIVYGIIIELAGVWFVEDKLRYTSGLLIGIALAVGMAINIAVVVRDTVEIYGESGAKARVIAKSLLRYAVVVVVFFRDDEVESGKSVYCIYRGIRLESVCVCTAFYS